MKVIEGGYKKGFWMRDPDVDDETLEVFNYLFAKIAENERPEAAELIWHPKKEKPALKVVK